MFAYIVCFTLPIFVPTSIRCHRQSAVKIDDEGLWQGRVLFHRHWSRFGFGSLFLCSYWLHFFWLRWQFSRAIRIVEIIVHLQDNSFTNVLTTRSQSVTTDTFFYGHVGQIDQFEVIPVGFC